MTLIFVLQVELLLRGAEGSWLLLQDLVMIFLSLTPNKGHLPNKGYSFLKGMSTLSDVFSVLFIAGKQQLFLLFYHEKFALSLFKISGDELSRPVISKSRKFIS